MTGAIGSKKLDRRGCVASNFIHCAIHFAGVFNKGILSNIIRLNGVFINQGAGVVKQFFNGALAVYSLVANVYACAQAWVVYINPAGCRVFRTVGANGSTSQILKAVGAAWGVAYILFLRQVYTKVALWFWRVYIGIIVCRAAGGK